MKIKSLPSSFQAVLGPQLGRIGLLVVSLFFGQWFLTDIIHFPGGGIGLLLTGVGVWWVLKPVGARFDTPSSPEEWIERCKETLNSFEELEGESEFAKHQQVRLDSLQEVVDRSDPQQIGIVSSFGTELPEESSLLVLAKSLA